LGNARPLFQDHLVRPAALGGLTPSACGRNGRTAAATGKVWGAAAPSCFINDAKPARARSPISMAECHCARSWVRSCPSKQLLRWPRFLWTPHCPLRATKPRFYHTVGFPQVFKNRLTYVMAKSHGELCVVFWLVCYHDAVLSQEVSWLCA
jgi:hypothetical protein